MKKVFSLLFILAACFFVMAVSASAASLSWEQEEIYNVTKWEIQYSETGGFQNPQPLGSGVLLKEDAVMENGEYVFSIPEEVSPLNYFRVRAMNDFTESEWAGPVSGTIYTPVRVRLTP